MKLERKVYETRREKVIDFFAGFFGWYGANLIVLIVVLTIGLAPGGVPGPTRTSGAVEVILWAAPLVLNAVAIVLLALKRHCLALGALAAVGTILLLVLVATALLILMAACSGVY